MSKPSREFKALSLAILGTVLAIAVLGASAHALFGTKVAPLFGMSPDALAGSAEAAPKKLAPADAGSLATDGGARRPKLSPLGATKSGVMFHKEDFEKPAEQSPSQAEPGQ